MWLRNSFSGWYQFVLSDGTDRTCVNGHVTRLPIGLKLCHDAMLVNVLIFAPVGCVNHLRYPGRCSSAGAIAPRLLLDRCSNDSKHM
jgi:hypothetical protein